MIFGDAAEAYGRLINEIAPCLTRERYAFEDLEVYRQKSLDPVTSHPYAGQIYWSEILARAHMASVSSILRTTRWADAALREYIAGNLFGWASSCRSLIESAGDSGHSLSGVPLTLAKHHRGIKNELSGKNGKVRIFARELEDALIHFSHARKIKKNEDAPQSHKAMQSTEYIKFIEDMKVVGVRELYAYLCELVHPAASSISTLFVPCAEAWVLSPENEQVVLKKVARESSSLMAEVMMAAYNPPILILKVLHTFDLFTKIDVLRKFDFSQIPLWPKIALALRS